MGIRTLFSTPSVGTQEDSAFSQLVDAAWALSTSRFRSIPCHFTRTLWKKMTCKMTRPVLGSVSHTIPQVCAVKVWAILIHFRPAQFVCYISSKNHLCPGTFTISVACRSGVSTLSPSATGSLAVQGRQEDDVLRMMST